MIKAPQGTILYDIRKKNGQEGYGSYCNGTRFCPPNMKVVGCGTENERCIEMNEEEKKQQTPPLKKI